MYSVYGSQVISFHLHLHILDNSSVFGIHSRYRIVLNSISIVGYLGRGRVRGQTKQRYSYNTGRKCIENIWSIKFTIKYFHLRRRLE